MIIKGGGVKVTVADSFTGAGGETLVKCPPVQPLIRFGGGSQQRSD